MLECTQKRHNNRFKFLIFPFLLLSQLLPVPHQGYSTTHDLTPLPTHPAPTQECLLLATCSWEARYQPVLLFRLKIFPCFLLHYDAGHIWTPQLSCWCAGPLHLTLIYLVVVYHPAALPGFLLDDKLCGLRAISCLWLEHPVIMSPCRESTNLAERKKKRKLLSPKAGQQYKICSCIWSVYLVIYKRPDKESPFQARTLVSSAWEIIEWDGFCYRV